MRERNATDDPRSRLREAAIALRQTREERDRLLRSAREPIAIVGVGCRLPGKVRDLDSLWTLLASGAEATGRIPADRWDGDAMFDPDPDAPGRSYVRSGSFLESIDRFDAAFFGISPREAAWMDPQHRLLLECAWEALENAAISPTELRGRPVGMFVGIGPSEYSQTALAREPEHIEGYAATGTGTSFSAGRVSYLLGLQGPSLAVDTACSSSLVALHLACQSLRKGECEVALAAGVQVMLSSGTFILLSRLRALAPDGRCKSFSAQADGYGRGEGCGVLALKRLSDARRDGDRILALVRGSAINHDGPSSGLTAPNGSSQRILLRDALRSASLAAADVDYVEAHGTGTTLGDPIEALALADVYGDGRSSPLEIGSIKTNIGHLESAAGVAGVLKVVASLVHGALPPSLHARELNPHIPWDSVPLRVTRALVPWARGARPRRAGVSAFGMSGTNAHVLLEEAPEPERAERAPERAAYVLTLSARTETALTELAARHADFLTGAPQLRLADVCHTANTGRAHFEERLAVVAASSDEARERLVAWATGAPTPGVVRARAEPARSPRVAFLFTGQGSQYVGMGQELYDREPVFRAALERCAGIVDPLLERPLLGVLFGGAAEPTLLDETAYTQPALFALEYALSELWRSWGIVPTAVMGHSVGEYAAACLAGVFDVEDGLRLIAARARLMHALPRDGEMHSVRAEATVVEEALAPHAADACIAALNGPEDVVVSGRASAVRAVCRTLESRGIKTSRLLVSHAFHSPSMDPMLDEFEHIADGVRLREPRLMLVANVTGALAGPEIATAAYWRRHVRQPVRFDEGMRALRALGVDTFVEIGPQPVLLRLASASVDEAGCVSIPSLKKGRSAASVLAESVANLYARGASIDWRGFGGPSAGRRIALPTYPFERQRSWVDARRASSSLAPRAPHAYALSGETVSVPGEALHQVLHIGAANPPYLADHVVHSRVVVPGAFYVAVLLALAVDRFGADRVTLRDVQFVRPLLLEKETELHVVLVPTADKGFAFRVCTVEREPAGEARWHDHAEGTLLLDAPASSATPSMSLRQTPQHGVDSLFAGLRHGRIEWGPQWRWIEQVFGDAGGALVKLTPAAGTSPGEAPLHPALLDNSIAAGMLGSTDGHAEGTPYLPWAIKELRWYADARASVWCAGHATSTSEEYRVSDLVLFEETGNVLAEIEGLTLKRAPAAAFLGLGDASAHLFAPRWEPSEWPSPSPSTDRAKRWLVVSDGAARAESLRAALEGTGAESIACVAEGDEGFASAITRALEEQPVDGLVAWWSGEKGDDLASRAERAACFALDVTHAAARSKSPSPKLWFVTEGAQAVTAGAPVSPEGAPIWGLARVVMAEHPELACTLVDLEPGRTPDVDALRRELTATRDGETQIAIRADRRYVARLVKARESAVSDTLASPSYALVTAKKGHLDALRLVPAARRTPERGEVEIEVEASGLNFRDVLNALGMYPGEAGLLGGECAGVVTALGEGVSGLGAGDRVLAFAPGAFARYVTADARTVAKIPAGMSWEEAATVPVAFLTAWHALRLLAGLKKGERILIHAAAGGVGMAAVQVARWMGAEVYATASRPKWDAVRAMGVAHVADSRSIDFAKDVRAAAGEAGIDVVLNALAGEFTDESLALLRAGGRFIEMGKTDLRDPSQVASEHPGVSYEAFDLTQIPPDRISEMLARVLEGFASGDLRPLPCRTFRASEAEAAFRFMAQARHVGKIVLTPERGTRAVAAGGTVLVTGGLGALGLRVARWLAERRSVKHLLLVGRGARADEARPELDELRAMGAEVTVASADVSDRAHVRALLAGISADRPLRGVVHAAGIVEDAVLEHHDHDKVARVLAPKVRGAFNLHEETRGLPLDLFVMFSSAAGLLGNAGQAAYAAANAFLDALAHARRAQGLPAQSLDWGPWTQGGMAERMDAASRARLERLGFGALAPDSALQLFHRATAHVDAQLAPIALDLHAARAAFAETEPPSILRALVSRPAARPRTSGSAALATRLARLSPQERHAEVEAAVRAEIAKVLSLPSPTAVPLERPLKELGLDSLMAVELRNGLSAQTGQRLPATVVFDFPTVTALTDHLLASILVPEANAPEPAPLASPSDPDEPIAVIGVSCRFPGGASTPERLWEMLRAGVDAITEVPLTRWDVDRYYDPDPDAAGKMYTRWGGFLADVDRFDPAFFGIAPREAVSMDPQHRLLLEVTWEALERAGKAPDRLLGARGGVFVGICGNEYGTRLMQGDPASIDPYCGTGNFASVAAGRISYVLGLQGPAISVDTACSSSLVSVHLACQSLRAGDCDLALAGGVNLMLAPQATILFSRLRAMSPDGRCKSFDAGANGYVRGEGCGMVVLRRLSDALRDDDPILAVIRGSAVNQDGRSNGLTAPNGPAQQSVIRDALRQANIAPARVGYVETHGTGTPLGDPIEVGALGAVLGQGRSADDPLWIGAIKTNIGHTEGAAGVAGLIKAVLALVHEEVPPNLHFTRPSPHIAWDELPVKVPTTPVAWRRNGSPRIAGVSSFGMSGTNAHVVLEEAPAAPRATPQVDRAAHLLVLSAKSDDVLREQAARYAEHLASRAGQPFADLCYTAAAGRTHFEGRLAVVASTPEEARRTLQAFASGEDVGTRGHAQLRSPKVAFLFTGQGSQYAGMGKELYDSQPVFRQALDRCFETLNRLADVRFESLLLSTEDAASKLDDTLYTQPALFALEYALAALLGAWGIEPGAVLGHSVGEYVAACVAGVMTLEDALDLVVARARLMAELPRDGAMASIVGARARVAEIVERHADALSIAAFNGPEHVVLSGRRDAVDLACRELEQLGARARRMNVSHAFHSPLMDPMLDAFERRAGAITFAEPRIALASNVSGTIAGPEVRTAAYWRRHVREPVRFEDGLRALRARGVDTFVELGPHPTLLAMGMACFPDEPCTWAPSLRRGQPAWSSLLEGIAKLYVNGVTIDWERFDAPYARRRGLAPTYAFRRQTYWSDRPAASPAFDPTERVHPLLGARVPFAGSGTVFEAALGTAAISYLEDHRVFGRAVLPATAFLEIFHAAAAAALPGGPCRVREVVLSSPLVLPEPGSARVQVVVTAEDAHAKIGAYSRAEAETDDAWTLHATGTVAVPPSSSEPEAIELGAIASRCTSEVERAAFYGALEAGGLKYGPAFQGVERLWRGRGEALAKLSLSVESGGLAVHPALLDAALQTLGAALAETEDQVFLPFAVTEYRVWSEGATRGWAHARLHAAPSAGAEIASGDVRVVDDAGRVLAEVIGLQLKRAARDALAQPAGERMYELAWREQTTRGEEKLPRGEWVVLGGGDLAGRLAERLRAYGATCRVLSRAGEVPVEGPLAGVVCSWGDAREALDPAADAEARTAEGIALVQALLRRNAPATRLWWIMPAAESAGLSSSGLWGLGRVVMAEHPELACTLVGVDPTAPDALDAICAELVHADDETQIVYRSGKRHVARLAAASARPADRSRATTGGAVLVTGGLGALGLRVARWLVEARGIRELVLVARRAPSEPQLAQIEELRGRGATVTVARADVSDAAQVAALVASIGGSLRGVVHAAGVLEDALLERQTPEGLARVFASKARGAWHLHEATRQLPLDFFVMFSSLASILGNAGQANYAAANAFLDALAHHRRSLGLTAHALGFGPWSGGGMADTMDAASRARLARLGLATLAPEQALALLEQAIGRPEAHLGLFSLDLRALRKWMTEPPPFWRALVPAPTTKAARGGALAARLATIPEEARKAESEAMVRAEVARVLSLPGPSDVPLERPLQELGLDSLMAVDLRNRLSALAGEPLPATLVFDYPNVAALARRLLEVVVGKQAIVRSARVADGPRPTDEPIAIVGIGCRYPGGVTDVASFWELLESGIDGIAPIPRERWDVDELYDPDPDAVGKIMTREGGFLSDVDTFDAPFFGIAPREAEKMDPQQRLLLEVSWEALEHAGIAPERLMGSDTGVFVGMMYHDYAGLITAGLEDLDGYVGTGSAGSVASGRISYALGLKGPSVTLDTACSSSLVTVHLACQSLRSGECGVALAGGATLMLTPAVHVEFSRLRGLAADGRCKSFDARADGVAWSEGCGMLVLKRLSDAVRDGDRVLGVIRGSAVNQDGRSNGLTAPNGPSQEAVIRRALEQANIAPAEVGYVEAHGTGTPLGDPIELQALGAVLGEGRAANDALLVGSVKSNFGHTQAAAGAAGLIKAVLSLESSVIPRTLHFREPNPRVAWAELPLKVTAEATPWPAARERRIVGVSSFGISGTNAHVLVERAPAAGPQPASSAGPHLLVLSAQTSAALRAQAARFAAYVNRSDATLADICYTAGARRGEHTHRLAVVADSRAQIEADLDAFAKGETRPGMSAGTAWSEGTRKLAFIFPGQGGQWLGMGRALLESQPVFREAILACEAAIRDLVTWSLVDVLRGEGPDADLSRVDVVQPAVFAMQVGLARLWRAWGITPAAVVGHSMGEIAAAHVAGALSLEDACRIVCVRSQLVRRASGRGAMALVELSPDEARRAIAGRENDIAVAAENSPRTAVLSGDRPALESLLEALGRREVFCRFIDVDYASHGPQMDALAPELLATIADVASEAPRTPLYSTVTGDRRGEALEGEYWQRNLRDPVRFWPAVEALVRDGVDTFVEVSAHPTLLPAIDDGLRERVAHVVAAPSLRRGDGGTAALLGALGQLWTAGYSVDWSKLYPDGGRIVSLPTYPWQRARYWVEPRRTQRPRAEGHALVGRPVTVSQSNMRVWEAALALADLPYLADHKVEEAILLPAAAYVDLALTAGKAVYGDAPFWVDGLELHEALTLDAEAARTVQLVASELQTGAWSLRLTTLQADGSWTKHASAVLRTGEPPEGDSDPLDAARSRCSSVVEREPYYEKLLARGLVYGPAFRGLVRAWRGEGEAIGEIELPKPAGDPRAYTVHPALLDACLQVLAAPSIDDEGGRGPAIPVRVGAACVHGPVGRKAWAHVRVRGGSAEADVRVFDDAGRLLVEARAVRVQQIERDAGPKEDLFLMHEWRPADAVSDLEAGEAGAFLLLADEGGVAKSVEAELRRRGASVERVSAADVRSPESFDRILAGKSFRTIVHLFALDGPSGAETDATSLEAARVRDCGATLHLVQAIARAALRDAPRLWIVTRGAHVAFAGDAPPSPASSMSWGLARTIANEHPELRTTRVDLGARTSQDELEALVRELTSDEREEEIALRADRRYVGRIVRRAPDASAKEISIPAGDTPFRLEIDEPGVLDRLTLRRTTRRPPAPGEVEIAVEAAGLNFLDVLMAMGVIPRLDDSPAALPLGGECAGRVVAVGEGVSDVRVGDDVVALAQGAIGSFVTTPAALVVARPAALTAEQAATLPVVHLTAYYGLAHVARLSRGERVLVHAATGGVGLAALQWAKHVGAEVFATAGSPEKREHLRALGVARVSDSRSARFVDDVLEWTEGDGVDVVLNSLSGELIEKSFGLLRDHGRFVEIGKRDYFANAQLGLRPFLKNLSYTLVDLLGMAKKRPARVREVFQEVMALVERGVLGPIPHRTFGVSEARDAFRTMAQARHIGKLVVKTAPNDELRVMAPARGDVSLRADGTYLLTGGLGGLGLAVARWMVGAGARHLVLVGRSGAATEEQKQAIFALEAEGARVLVAKADVASREDLAGVLDRARREGLPPLRGVVHAAGLLDDAMLLQQNLDRFANVMGPKVLGAWNLHELTRDMPLDFFVLYSSASALLGSPGQGNYAAANAFLDALAHYRRACGLPALSIDWGAFADVGLAAAQDNRAARLARQGLRGLTSAEGNELLAKLLGSGETQVGVVPMDFRHWVAFAPHLAGSRLLSDLVRAAEDAAQRGGDRKLREALMAAPEPERRALLERYLLEQVANVTRIDASRLEASTPFKNLGIDSLMGLELRNRLEAGLGLKLSATLIWTYPSAATLAQHLSNKLGAVSPPPPEAPTPAPEEPAGDASAEETERLFEEQLAALEERVT